MILVLIVKQLPVLNKGLFVFQLSQKRPRRSQNIFQRGVVIFSRGKIHHWGNKEEYHSVDVDEKENVRNQLEKLDHSSVDCNSVLKARIIFNQEKSVKIYLRTSSHWLRVFVSLERRMSLRSFTILKIFRKIFESFSVPSSKPRQMSQGTEEMKSMMNHPLMYFSRISSGSKTTSVSIAVSFRKPLKMLETVL